MAVPLFSWTHESLLTLLYSSFQFKLFNDDKITDFGSWKEVIEVVVAGRYQPVLLVYELKVDGFTATTQPSSQSIQPPGMAYGVSMSPLTVTTPGPPSSVVSDDLSLSPTGSVNGSQPTTLIPRVSEYTGDGTSGSSSANSGFGYGDSILAARAWGQHPNIVHVSLTTSRRTLDGEGSSIEDHVRIGFVLGQDNAGCIRVERFLDPPMGQDLYPAEACGEILLLDTLLSVNGHALHGLVPEEAVSNEEFRAFPLPILSINHTLSIALLTYFILILYRQKS